MRSRWLGPATLCTVLTLVACGAEEPRTPRTDDVTQTLLGSAGSAGVAAPSGEATPIPERDLPEGPVPVDQRIAIAPLGINYGSDDAPVQVLEMSDFGCTYCRRFHEDTWPVIASEFVETDKVQWKFVPFVTGMFANSRAVTEVAECAMEQSDALFNAVADRLWSEQDEWKGHADPSGLARGWAEAAGAEPDQLDACLAGGGALRKVAVSSALSRQLRVRGTPTFFVLGYAPIQGVLPTELFRELLGQAHQLATTAGGDAGG